jgi:hypothetical protein
MELMARTYSHLSWQVRSFKDMLVRVPFATAAGTAALVGSRFAQLFAFFLPLKVLIMLSSDRVPRAFHSLITAENRHFWLVVFSVATLALYALSVFLRTMANRTITVGIDQLLRSQTNLPKREKRQFRRQYTVYCHAGSDAMVFLLGAIGIAFLNPLVLLGMIVVLTMELLVTGWLLESSFSGFLGWVREGIKRNVNSYIQYLSAVNFLALFVLIIIDYFVQGGLSIYIAVLTMILGRQAFNSLTKFVKRMLSLDVGDDDEEQ